MSKHSKWVYCPNGVMDPPTVEYLSVSGDCVKVCQVYSSDKDAALIAAAPDMLEALKYYFDVLKEVNGSDWDKKPDHVLLKMLNATKKAEGKL